jgi:CRP-like cAMP-binding protein
MNTTEFRRFLRGLPEFERLGERSLDTLAAQMQVKDYPAGHVLVTQGQCGTAMQVVISGRIEMGALSPEDGESHELPQGSIVGLLSFASVPELESYCCKEPVQVGTLSRERFNALFSLAPAAARLIQYMLAVKLARLLQEQNRALRQACRAKANPTLKKSESLFKQWLGV